MPGDRVCRECGCTNDQACVRPLGPLEDTRDAVQDVYDGRFYLPCMWIEDDLCSACAPGAGSDWQHHTATQEVPSP